MKVNIYKDQHKNKIKSDKTISVIIPNYNYADYIIERIDSILFQTIKINELIILDDASADNSVEIINKKIDKVKRDYPDINIKFIINKENSGGFVFSQWQKGLKKVTSSYFWIAEADDSSNCNFLETAFDFFDKDNDLSLFYCESMVIDAKNRVVKKDCKDWSDIFHSGHWDNDYINTGRNEIINYLSSNATILNVSSIVWKNDERIYDIFEEAKQYKIAGDWYIYTRILENGKIGFSNQALNYFRKHGKSVSTLDIRDKEYKEVLRIHEYIKTKYKLNDDLIEKQRIRRAFMGYTENKNNNGTKGSTAWFVPVRLKNPCDYRTIIRNAEALIKEGYRCDFYFDDRHVHTPNELFSIINECYGEFNGDVYSDWGELFKNYDVCIAVGCESVPALNEINCKKVFFSPVGINDFIDSFKDFFHDTSRKEMIIGNMPEMVMGKDLPEVNFFDPVKIKPEAVFSKNLKTIKRTVKKMLGR